MKRFYEIWNAEPAEGVKAPTVAGALRQAQAWVAAQDKWSHPYYWAGWVVWSAGG
jgi:CHAT domain-containing protein